MARRGWSTANFLGLEAAIATATPLTMGLWAKTSITGVQQTLFVQEQSSAIAGRNNFSLQVDTLQHVFASTGDASANSQANTTTTFAANTWFHACGVWASPTSRIAYLNGGGKSTQTTSRTPAGINRTTVGLTRQGTSVLPWAASGTGDLAEVAIWNAALSDAEVLRLASGISPLAVRRESLAGYWRLMGGGASEVNVVNPTQPLTLGGALTLQAQPPKSFMPVLPLLTRPHI